MRRIVTCNLKKDYNLGGPSILLGLNELLNKIYKKDYEIVNIQGGEYIKDSNDGLPIKTIFFYPPTKRHIWRFLFGYNEYKGLGSIIKELKKADIVVDLYGICFCDQLGDEGNNKAKFRLWDFGTFTIAIIAKGLLHKKVIKNTASYGPMNSLYTRDSARYMCEEIFDRISAREVLSKERLLQICAPKNKVLVSPDIANLMPYENLERCDRVAISISHRIERQWKSKEKYEDCISNLCRHILDKYDMGILLVPNECKPDVYNDVSVGNKILTQFKNEPQINMLQVKQLTAQEIKNEIVRSKILVGSRYHSCVAALSGGTPTIVIGWHNKYEELLGEYGQTKWILSNEDCKSDKLIQMVDQMIHDYSGEIDIIRNKGREVKEKVIEIGEVLFKDYAE